MAEQVLAAVRTAPGTTSYREYPMPDVPADGALLKVEVAGICGTDVKMYASPPFPDPVIMGHENAGVIARAGREFVKRHDVDEGDRVFVEHYVGCYHCAWCHAGEYRHCENTDWRTNPDARRYGYTSAEHPPHLWGGFAQYLYLPWNAVLHKLPGSVGPELAGIATPLSNGIEWALVDGGVGYDSTVLIEGPGQQGLSQTVACKQAGASLIIVTGTAGTPPGWSWPSGSAPTTRSTCRPRIRPDGSGRSPAAPAWTWCSTAPRGPVRRRCCSASTRSSAGPARSSSRASWPRSPTSR